MRAVGRVTAVAAGVAAVIAGTVSPASAGTSFEVFTSRADRPQCSMAAKAGSVKFVDNGEHLYVKDRRADGHGVVAIVEVNGEYDVSISNYRGKGTTNHYDRSYPEGAKVRVFVQIDHDTGPCAGNYGNGVA